MGVFWSRAKAYAYARGPGRFYEPAHRALAEVIAREAGPFLDIGCGPGGVLGAISTHSPETRCIGIDRNPSAVAGAQALHGQHKNLGFEVMEGRAMTFPNDSFGCVLGIQSMKHWREPDAVLREVARVLCPGGVLLLFQADPEGEIPAHWIRRRGGWPTDGVLRTRWRRFSPPDRFLDDLPQRLTGCGFKNPEVGHEGFYRTWRAEC